MAHVSQENSSQCLKNKTKQKKKHFDLLVFKFAFNGNSFHAESCPVTVDSDQKTRVGFLCSEAGQGYEESTDEA